MSQRDSDEPINDSAAGLVTIDSTLGTMDGPHMLVENLPRRSNNKRPQDIDNLPTEKDKLLTRALIRTKANVHLNRKRKADNDETRHQRKLLRLSSSEGV